MIASFAAAVVVGIVASSPAITLDALYGNRLLFSEDGNPLVPVRMMEGRERVEIFGADGLVVRASGGTHTLPPGTTVVVERLNGTPAVIRRALVLETLEGEERKERNAARARWSERGINVRLESIGGVYGMRGTVFDNRTIQVVTDEKTATQVFDAHGVRPIEKEWMVEMPKARFRVSGGALQKDVTDLVEISAPSKTSVVVVRRVEHSRGYDAHGFEDRELFGAVVLVVDQAGLMGVVNVVPEATLVAGILPSEMFATAPMDALKAQAVTARGEVFAKIGQRHLADPYLVCSEQHCQVYKGRTAEHPRTNEAARTTAGELAFKDGRLVDSVYSACCGGHTEPSHVVWDQPAKSALTGTVDAPFADPESRPWELPATWNSTFSTSIAHDLKNAGALPPSPIPIVMSDDAAVKEFLDVPRDAAFCGRSTFNQKGDAWRWSRRFTVDELTARFSDTNIGRVRRIEIEERGPGGRLRALRVDGDKGSTRIFRELPVRRRLGNLKSGLFVVDEERDAAGTLLAVTLRGAGFGHGSGMCQQGAIGMAEMGYGYQEILRHYFNGATVVKVF